MIGTEHGYAGGSIRELQKTKFFAHTIRVSHHQQHLFFKRIRSLDHSAFICDPALISGASGGAHAYGWVFGNQIKVSSEMAKDILES